MRAPANLLSFCFDELTSLDALLEVGPDLGQRRVSHRTPERVCQQVPLLGNSLTLQVSLFREGHPRVSNLVSRDLGDVMRPCSRCRYDTLWLIAESRRHLLMPALHLVVRQSEFRFARLVRRDLRGCRAAAVFLCKMFLDLLPARTRSLQILAGVAFDFRLAALALLDLVTEPSSR